MSITADFEAMVRNAQITEQLTQVQDLRRFQEFHLQMLADGLIQKRDYNLAAVNVLGAAVPGQTTYKVDLI